ncbi:MAG: DUF6483 family protein [Ignavibacteriales bacterium]|nr:DUF6483 family protein [Ignavibacteriales bacterium]
MITRDYFMRMIHQLAQVIGKVLKLNEVKQYTEALEEIQLSSKLLLGMDLRLLTSLSDTEFIRFFSLGERFDVEKCIVTAKLLRLTGEVRERQADEHGKYSSYTTSLSLFLELLFRESETLPKEYFDEIDGLIGKLSSYELSSDLLQKLFRFYGIVRRYDIAENVLFELVERDSGFGEEGVKFYERLRTKSDEELERGNLPRNEIEAGLTELLRKTSS